jgi:hypothetical protein
MASNKRFLKAYARFDGSGRIVPSSTILRKNKPKVGSWKEVQTYLCCNGTELFYTPESYPIINIQFAFSCNGTIVISEFIYEEANDLNELIALLNDNPTNQFGYFVGQSDGSIKLTVPDSVKALYCPTGTMSFQVIPS